MSLRLRLTLVMLALIAVMGIVSLVSFRVDRKIQRRAEQLSRTSMVDMDRNPVIDQGIEVKGTWTAEGVFLATDVASLTRSRQPKLRGAIQAIDREEKSLTLFGRRIRVNRKTEYPYDDTADPFEDLKPGQRVEVSCRVDRQGRWFARKIRTRAIKTNNKVKGTITETGEGQDRSERLEVHGLPIVLAHGITMDNPRSPLYRMENATRMVLAIRACLATSHELLEERYRERNLLASGKHEEAGKVKTGIEEVEDRLLDQHENYAYHLARSKWAAEEAMRLATVEGSDDLVTEERERIELWLGPLAEKQPRFAESVARFPELAATDVNAADKLLRDLVEPHLGGEILPLVRAYQADTEEELSDELKAIAAGSEAATRFVIAINVAGLILALALGLIVAHSISSPIRALTTAARKIGRGNLDTRIDVRTQDELGVLGHTFNRMAEELATSTVSVGNLNNVIDSMAGALLILDRDGKIASVNPSTLALLGYEEDELAGEPFETICPNRAGGETTGAILPAAEGIGSVVERSFCRKDGSSIPVSFSGATLRDETGSIRGFVCVAQDLTEHKRMEDQLRKSLSDKELLLHEVQHRVKNNLQVISSLLDLQSRSIVDPVALEKFQESQNRIRSMVFIHEQLHDTRDLEEVDFRSYMERLTANLSQSYLVQGDRLRLTTRVAEMKLDLDCALACGLIVNELVTNAFKHAFPEDASGEISVSADLGNDGNCMLEVSDNGRGFDERFDTEGIESLGLNLVRTQVEQVHGKLRIDGRNGVTIQIEFPVKTASEVV